MNFYISQFVVWFLIFIRVMTMFGFAPVLSHGSVPAMTKVGLSILISYILFTAHGASPFTDVSAQLTLGSLVIFVVREVIVGLAIGYALTIVLAGIQFAGYLISSDMGLAMANIFNPDLNEQVPVLSQLMNIIAMLVFLLIDGHLFLIESLKASFDVIPLASVSGIFSQGFIQMMIQITASVFVIAIKIAAPVMAAMFLTTIGLGILSRIVPQMQVFVFSMGLKVGVGLLMLTGTVPMYVFMIKKILVQFEGQTYTLLQLMRP
ncbi:MAG TPA: flagellar biosynthetic protein FliR [Bacteroidota bacterium]|nr:flagellar biosynthetic protein FliR [Bacteroidota bacterium]